MLFLLRIPPSLGCVGRRHASRSPLCLPQGDDLRPLLPGFRHRSFQCYGVAGTIQFSHGSTHLAVELLRREAPHDAAATLVEDAVGTGRGFASKFVAQTEAPDANKTE